MMARRRQRRIDGARDGDFHDRLGGKRALAEIGRGVVDRIKRRCDQQPGAAHGGRETAKLRKPIERQIDFRDAAGARGAGKTACLFRFDMRGAEKFEHGETRVEARDNQRRDDRNTVRGFDAGDGAILDKQACDARARAYLAAFGGDGGGQCIRRRAKAAKRNGKPTTEAAHRHAVKKAQHGAKGIGPIGTTQHRVEGERAFQQRVFEFGIQKIADRLRQQMQQVGQSVGTVPPCAPDETPQAGCSRRRVVEQQRREERGMRLHAPVESAPGSGVLRLRDGQCGDVLAVARHDEMLAVAVERHGRNVARRHAQAMFCKFQIAFDTARQRLDEMGNRRDTVIGHDLAGDGDAAERRAFFQHQDALMGAAEIGRGGKTVQVSADHDCIVFAPAPCHARHPRFR